MKITFHALLVWGYAASAGFALDILSLQEVVTNTKKDGQVWLKQGYHGKINKVFGDPPEPPQSPLEFEFTHGLLKFKTFGTESRPAQAIAVGIEVTNNGDLKKFRDVAVYLTAIPDFQQLSQLPTIEKFERIFGDCAGNTIPWAFDGEVAYSTMAWMTFTIQPDGSIRVVKVNLTKARSSTGSKIEKRCIQEGIFHATGKPPVLTRPEKKKVEVVPPNGP